MAHVTYEYNKDRIKMWRVLNADKWREYQRNYMRERRLREWEQRMAGLAVPNVPNVPTDLEPIQDLDFQP
jgi:hypothetical protein